jgi:hypothetical protein
MLEKNGIFSTGGCYFCMTITCPALPLALGVELKNEVFSGPRVNGSQDESDSGKNFGQMARFHALGNVRNEAARGRGTEVSRKIDNHRDWQWSWHWVHG